MVQFFSGILFFSQLPAEYLLQSSVVNMKLTDPKMNSSSPPKKSLFLFIFVLDVNAFQNTSHFSYPMVKVTRDKIIDYTISLVSFSIDIQF